MIARSNRAEVRNPVLALPTARRFAELSPDVRALLADLFGDIAADARDRAQKAWRTHKAPMALYWKVVSVWARHISRAIRPGSNAGLMQEAA